MICSASLTFVQVLFVFIYLTQCFCVCYQGVVAECQQERSQLKNKEKAMKALRAKLYSMKLEEETSKRYNQRKVQVG